MKVHSLLSHLAIWVVVCLSFLGLAGCGPQAAEGEPGEGDTETISTQLAGIPPAPGSLSASPLKGGIKLSWPSVSGATYYQIFRGTSSGYHWPYEIVYTNSFKDMSPGTQYFYVVRAGNDYDGESDDSPEATATGWANLGLGRPVEQSTTWGSATADKAVDGNTDGIWGHGSVSSTNWWYDADGDGDGDSQWWRVDLGSSMSVYELDVWKCTDCQEVSDLEVWTSNDPTSSPSPTSWTKNMVAPGAVGAPSSINMVGLTARHVKILRTPINLALIMAEVQVWGTQEDNTSPTAPSGLTATATSSSSIKLSWTKASDNVGVKRYVVEQCKGSTCTYFHTVGYSTNTTYTNTGLDPNTTYRYRVYAEDFAQNYSQRSNVVTVTTPL